MELNIYNIIKGPRISDKAHAANRKLNKLVLEVHIQATKSDIKNAVQKLFSVKVDKVGTLISKNKRSKGTSKRRQPASTSMKKTKIAYVSLAEGYELNLFEQAEMPAASQAA